MFESPQEGIRISQKTTQYQKVLLSLEAELGHTDKRLDLKNKGTDTFTLKSSRVYCADLGTQNPYTIHAEKLSAQAQDPTTISSCLEHAKTAKEGSAATAPARKA